MNFFKKLFNSMTAIPPCRDSSETITTPDLGEIFPKEPPKIFSCWQEAILYEAGDVSVENFEKRDKHVESSVHDAYGFLEVDDTETVVAEYNLALTQIHPPLLTIAKEVAFTNVWEEGREDRGWTYAVLRNPSKKLGLIIIKRHDYLPTATLYSSEDIRFDLNSYESSFLGWAAYKKISEQRLAKEVLRQKQNREQLVELYR